MAIVQLESFKYYPNPAARYSLIAAATGTSTWSRQAGRNGGYALRHSNSSANDNAGASARIRIAIGNTFSIGFATYHPTTSLAAPATNGSGFQLMKPDDTVAVGVTMGAGATVVMSAVASGISLPTTVNGSITTTGWHWWNITGVYGNATTGFINVYRDGALMSSLSSDTLDFGPFALTSVQIAVGNYTGTCGFDTSDLVVRNDSNTIPDTRIDVLVPTSDVAAGWTRSSGSTNFSLVDDAGPTVDGSDYVSATAAATTDTYGLADLPHNPTTIYAVGVHAIGGKDSAGVRTAAAMVNSTEGTEMDTGTTGTVYNYWETNPSGGAAWTKASVDAMTAGIRIKS